MSMDLKCFTDSYVVLDNYLEAIKDYDEEMQTYYDLRDANRRVDSFSNQVVARLKGATENRAALAQIAEEQGFRLSKEK